MKGIELGMSAVTLRDAGQYSYYPGCALESTRAVHRKKAKQLSQFTLGYLCSTLSIGSC